MLILKIYLIITWLIGMVVGIWSKDHWDEIKGDDTFSPNFIIPLIILLFPVILPIFLISTIFERYDN